jgi:hypothetical protein
MNLDEVRKHMAHRNHAMFMTDDGKRLVYLTLADNVPGLVAEIERLELKVERLQAGLEWVKVNGDHASKVMAEDVLRGFAINQGQWLGGLVKPLCGACNGVNQSVCAGPSICYCGCHSRSV